MDKRAKQVSKEPGELKIFVASPGDVDEERLVAARVIREIGKRFRDRVRVLPVMHEDQSFVATVEFQHSNNIPHPCRTEIVVFIIWMRLGSPTSARYSRRDGRRITGTEWEFLDAVQPDAVQPDAMDPHGQSGQPDVLVFRKTATKTVEVSPMDE